MPSQEAGTPACRRSLDPGPDRTRPTRSRRTPLTALVLMASLMAAPSLAAGPYRLLGGVASGGGGHSQGARFAIEGTVGQTAAQPSGAGAGRFAVEAGFWAFAPAASGQLLADGFEP